MLDILEFPLLRTRTHMKDHPTYATIRIKHDGEGNATKIFHGEEFLDLMFSGPKWYGFDSVDHSSDFVVPNFHGIWGLIIFPC